MDETRASDLVDMSDFARDTKGNKFILSIIDVFSKYGWLIPLKNKKGVTVRDAFQAVCPRSCGQTKKLSFKTNM